MKKIAILGIDLQNDFTSPGGSLYVRGAEKDISNISGFISENGNNIDYIALTLDSHQPIHIASRIYWKDEEGNYPPLFTVITAKDVIDGKWAPQYNKDRALGYLKLLAEQGEICTIWPPHCILGSEGWTLDKKLFDALYKWCIDEGKSYELFYKGYHQATEHYSIFKAAVGYDDAPETKFNKQLVEKLDIYDEIIIVGEAADYCVASSLKDILDETPRLAGKTTVFTDCMSWITEENERATAIFEKAESYGVRFMESTEYIF